MPIMGPVTGSSQLRRGLAEARLRTDELFALVRPDSLFERPVPERHRLNFYIGHVEAFDWNMICVYSLGSDPFHAEFDKLFAFGIDPDASDLPADVPSDWPSLDETYRYSRRVREMVDNVLDLVPEEIANVCIEHRLMHAETLCYLLHNLGPRHMVARTFRATRHGPTMQVPASPEWIGIPAGGARLGRVRGTGFGWDNEFGALAVRVPEFAIGKHKVTNAVYLEFVNAGGSQPHYWRLDGGRWLLRTMFGEVPLPLDWPVYVSHTQATQFAAQAGASLPSEAQWDRAAFGSQRDSVRQFPWGDSPPGPTHGNLNFRRWDPCSVSATPDGESEFGVAQALGNGWEWTSDPLRPFPGFQEYPFYPSYSSDFFDDEHFVLKGASPRTALPLLRRSFRNWFRRGYPYLHATFRLVKS